MCIDRRPLALDRRADIHPAGFALHSDGDVERDVEGGDTLPMPMSGDFMCQLNTNALVQLAVGPGTSEFTGGFGAV
jgi:hypothetical protein